MNTNEDFTESQDDVILWQDGYWCLRFDLKGKPRYPTFITFRSKEDL